MEQNDFENIAAAIRAKVLGVARRYGLSEEEAEDTAQDTMLKLWAMRDELDRYRSVEALAVSIAAHLSVSVLRRQRPVTLDGRSLITDGSPGPDTRLEMAENEQWLSRKLARLPSSEYQVLHLRQVECKTNGEIAAIMGIAVSSVATLLCRARQRLLEDIRKRKIINGRHL